MAVIDSGCERVDRGAIEVGKLELGRFGACNRVITGGWAWAKTEPLWIDFAYGWLTVLALGP